jgi:hypothetical protein
VGVTRIRKSISSRLQNSLEFVLPLRAMFPFAGEATLFSCNSVTTRRHGGGSLAPGPSNTAQC